MGRGACRLYLKASNRVGSMGETNLAPVNLLNKYLGFMGLTVNETNKAPTSCVL